MKTLCNATQIVTQIRKWLSRRHDPQAALVLAPLLLSFILLLFFIPPGLAAQSSVNKIVWQPLGKNIDLAQAPLRSGFFFHSKITLLRFSLSDYRIAVIRATDFGLTRGSARILCQKSRGLACINASFFDETGKPLGLVVTRGMTLQNIHRGGKTLTGIFQISRQQSQIIGREKFLPESVIEAVQAGPRLISQNKKIPGLKVDSSPTRRTGVCLDNENRIILYLLDTGFFGYNLENLRDILLSETVNCRDALNLDGGGSAQLYIDARAAKDSTDDSVASIEGTDEVPLVLGVFARLP